MLYYTRACRSFASSPSRHEDLECSKDTRPLPVADLSNHTTAHLSHVVVKTMFYHELVLLQEHHLVLPCGKFEPFARSYQGRPPCAMEAAQLCVESAPLQRLCWLAGI